MTFQVGKDHSISPTIVHGPFASFSCYPAVPKGLTFDLTNGKISGILAEYSKLPFKIAILGVREDNPNVNVALPTSITTVDALPNYYYPTIPTGGIVTRPNGATFNYPIKIREASIAPITVSFACFDKTGNPFTGIYGIIFDKVTGNFGGTINSDGQVGFNNIYKVNIANSDGKTQIIDVMIRNQ